MINSWYFFLNMVSFYFLKFFFIYLILLNEKYDVYQMLKLCFVFVVVEVEYFLYKVMINGYVFIIFICFFQVISDGINMYIVKIQIKY